VSAWRLVPLAEAAELNPRRSDALAADELVSFVPMSAVSADTAAIEGEETRAFADVAKGYTPFLSGDLLVAKITPCFENRKIAQANLTRRAGFGSTEFHIVRPRSGKLDGRYALHFLRQERIRRMGERRMTGSAGQRRVPEHFLSQLEIPLPPLAAQQRFAEVLDRVETLRAKRRAALGQLNELNPSIFLDLFGDPGTNPKGLSIAPLGEYLQFVTSGARGWARFYAQTGSRFIRSLDVQMNYIGSDERVFVAAPDNAEARRTKVRAGDVLLTITGSRIGRVAPVPGELEGSYISQHVAILRVNSEHLEPGFVSFFLSLECGGQRQIAGVQYGQTKPGLNFEQIRRFQVLVPPIDLQHEFARRVQTVEKLKAVHRASLAELDALFSSFEHRAFRGEL